MMTPFTQKGDKMYFKNLTQLNYIHNTVKYDGEWKISELPNDLFIKVINGELIKLIPLFYFDTVESSNPQDTIINDGKVIIAENNPNTVLHFFSDNDFVNEGIIRVTKRDGNIEDTLIFTYNPDTCEKIGHVRVDGILTDKYGYYHKQRRLDNV